MTDSKTSPGGKLTNAQMYQLVLEKAMQMGIPEEDIKKSALNTKAKLQDALDGLIPTKKSTRSTPRASVSPTGSSTATPVARVQPTLLDMLRPAPSTQIVPPIPINPPVISTIIPARPPAKLAVPVRNNITYNNPPRQVNRPIAILDTKQQMELPNDLPTLPDLDSLSLADVKVAPTLTINENFCTRQARVSTLNRIAKLYAQPEYQQRLLSIISAYGVTEEQLRGILAQRPKNDYVIYGQLGQYQKSQVYDRVKVRVNQIDKVLGADQINPEAGDYLDFGCNDGNITLGVGEYLGFNPISGRSEAGYIYGCDFIPADKVNPEIIYTSLNVGQALPYDSAKFSLVTSVMVLHHLDNIEAAVREFYRILVAGGYVVLREHSVTSTEMTDLLNVVHDLFVCAWTGIQTEEFSTGTETHGNYQSAQYFDALFDRIGFIRVDHERDNFKEPKRNPQNKFWRVYRKPR